MADTTLDCSGLNCPIPIVKTSKAIKKLDSGQTIEVIATDPAFEADIYAWAKRLRHTIVEYGEIGEGKLRALIQKK